MTREKLIEELMDESGVKFGTSGARGLVSDMTDRVCALYTLGFLAHLKASGQLRPGASLAIGGDRRPSTPRILGAIAAAARQLGHPVENLGLIPSPAVAQFGIEHQVPTVMVTGSHIPADRNGMKYTTATGEITKDDETGMRAARVVEPNLFDASGALKDDAPLEEENLEAIIAYRARYLDAFPKDCLKGIRLGVYGHSAVGRDVMVDLYEALGATVFPLGFSEEFIPVDTEAIRDEDVQLAAAWAKEHQLDAIVSTDGDSDRPLISDETGEWFRGDVAGILTARYFGATGVATPVSCNGALELAGDFPNVTRTRIGSPFVITGMNELKAAGSARVVGYEANGGFLHVSPLDVPGGGTLAPLPTRDPVIVHLALLLLARKNQGPLSALKATLPARFTQSGRDQAFPNERSAALLTLLKSATLEENAARFGLGPIERLNATDGLRFFFASGDVVHLRPSGNAPELRCYSEAATNERAVELVGLGLRLCQSLV